MEADYYNLLGISHRATLDEIKKAYHDLAKLHHPDKNGGSQQATKKFQRVRSERTSSMFYGRRLD